MYLNQAINMFNADMAKGSNIFMTKSSTNNIPDLWGLAFINCHLHVHSTHSRNLVTETLSGQLKIRMASRFSGQLALSARSKSVLRKTPVAPYFRRMYFLFVIIVKLFSQISLRVLTFTVVQIRIPNSTFTVMRTKISIGMTRSGTLLY